MKMEVLGGGVTLGRLQEPTDSTLSCPLSRQAGWAAQAEKVRETAEKNLAWLGLSCPHYVQAAGEAEPQLSKTWVHGMAEQPCGTRILGGGGGLELPQITR